VITFKQFNNNTIKTNFGVFQLQENIVHIEDLAPEEFLHNVKNIATLIATEKLDGAQLIAGVDNNGQFYTSREAKGGQRMYKNTTPTRAAENGFCAAFTALKQVEAEFKAIIKSGEAVECELLFGRQPNAIVYGSNYIAFLRMIPGDNQQDPNQDKIKQLNDTLKGHSEQIETSIITTIDGSQLHSMDQRLIFKFTSVAFIDNFEFHKVDLRKELNEFEAWMEQHPPSSFKTKKAFAEAASKFMLPIKEKLLNDMVRKLKPALRDAEVDSHEQYGIEGIVVLDPTTGKQFKLVDRSVFSVINQFNHAIRNKIKTTGPFNPEAFKHLYQSFEASLGTPGNSIYDNMLDQIARTINIPELGKYMAITRTLKKFGTLEALVKAMPQDVSKLRTQIAAIIKTTTFHLDDARKEFIQKWKDYKLRLNNGKEVRYTQEIYNRTLLVFAETSTENSLVLFGNQ
jgi:hypothetical protein